MKRGPPLRHRTDHGFKKHVTAVAAPAKVYAQEVAAEARAASSTIAPKEEPFPCQEAVIATAHSSSNFS